MSLPFRLHVLAEDDLVKAWEWYEAHERGLGDRFLVAVHAAIDQVADWPNSGSPGTAVGGKVIDRLVGTHGFPYLARYRIVDDTILVTAIYHQRRHPDFGSDRTP